MKLSHTNPCRECPFRKESAPGYLGADSPEGFIATTLADVPMPCHMTVDYEDKSWKETLDTNEVSYCAGALIFFTNTCKMSRDPERPRLPKSDTIFTGPQQFIAHHKRRT